MAYCHRDPLDGENHEKRQSSIQLLIFTICLTYLDVRDRYRVAHAALWAYSLVNVPATVHIGVQFAFFTTFFIFAILQLVDDLDQRNVFCEIF